ncbi:hypothetical protein ABZ567_11455 [Streptomyces sp. NPDC016459]|uniref:hypothetical protein n=1 Tax=Streptomyces sp. NPDC016459 TaxID=3157190 RepID=UPI0033E4845F
MAVPFGRGPVEARAPGPSAATPWRATEGPFAALHGGDPGRELYEYGFPQDVAVAAEVDGSTAVPVPADGVFQEAP